MSKHQPTEREITNLADLVESVNGHYNGTNRGVYAECGDGATHLLTGGIFDLDGVVYANTTYGVQEVRSAKVLE